MADDGSQYDGACRKMRSSVTEAMLVLEHHRAIFRFKNSVTPEDKIVFEEQVKQAEKRLNTYLTRMKLQQAKDKDR